MKTKLLKRRIVLSIILFLPFSTVYAESNLNMKHCKSVKIAAQAASKVYEVWSQSKRGSKPVRQKRFGSFSMLDYFMGNKDFGGLAVLFEYQGQCILSWKGTDFGDMRDIKADLFSLKGSSCKGVGQAKNKNVGNCGFGFKRQHDSIITSGLYSKLLKHVKTKCKNKKLIITGHSLGGALASIFSATIAVSNPILSQRSLTVTFGAPRVFGHKDGNRLHKVLKDRFLRIVSYGDPITSLPRAKVNFSMHFGEVIYLTTTGMLGEDWTYKSKHQNFSAYWNPSSVSKHKIQNYIDRVNRCH